MAGDGCAQAASVAKDLKEVFLREVKWRRQKAVEYPNDKRNLEAGKIIRAAGEFGWRSRPSSTRGIWGAT